MPVYLSIDPIRLAQQNPPVSDSDIDQLRRLGDAHHRAADIAASLVVGGWMIECGVISVLMRHPLVRTAKQAQKRLIALGINVDDALIISTPSPARVRKWSLNRSLGNSAKVRRNSTRASW